MKKTLFIFILINLSIGIWAKDLIVKEIGLYDDYCITYDKDDKFRYSPIKIFDKDDTTVYAFPRKETKDDFVFDISFSDEFEIDEILIKPGYFDSKYYNQNHRIKKISIDLFPEYKTYTFILNDEMKEQSLKFPSTKCSNVSFTIDEVYQSSKYDDVCISGLKFKNKNQEYDIKLKPQCTSTNEFTYDKNGNLLSEKTKGEGMNYDINYEKTVDGKYEGYGIDYYENVKRLIKSYINKGNIKEIIFDNDKLTLYFENNKIVKSVYTSPLGKNKTVYYFYKGDKLDHTDRGEYFYENGMLKGYFEYGHSDYYACYAEYNEKSQIYKISYHDSNSILFPVYFPINK